MASTGIIQRRYAKHELIANPPLVGELVFATDTQEFGTLIDQKIVWRTFEDSVQSVNGKTGKVELNKADIGLGNVDNTADIDKPISTPTKNIFTSHTSNKNNPHDVTKYEIGLGNVDNTSDKLKPLSEKMISALSLKLDVTGTANNSNKLGGIPSNHYLSLETGYTQTELNKMLDLKAPLASVYTKVVLDPILNTKADLSKVYTQKFINDNFENLSNKGAPNGYPNLGSDGKIPTSQLPASSISHQIVLVKSILDLPNTGSTDILYVIENINSVYRFDSSNNQYVNISVGLGTTDKTAYRGDRGKLAYDQIANLASTSTGKGSSLIGYIGKTGSNSKFSIPASTVDSSLNLIVNQIDKNIQDISNISSTTSKSISNIEIASGLNNDGTYTPPSSSNYLSTAFSLNNADILLDAKIKSIIDNLNTEISNRKISDSSLNKSIATNKTDIATNKTDIATNKTDIATNKTDIATNKTFNYGTALNNINVNSFDFVYVDTESIAQVNTVSNFVSKSNIPYTVVINGTNYTYTSSTVTAQVDTVVIKTAVASTVYAVDVNGTKYSYTSTDSSVNTIATGLSKLISNSIVDSSNNVIITAKTPGVAQTVTIDSSSNSSDISTSTTTKNVPLDSLATITSKLKSVIDSNSNVPVTVVDNPGVSLVLTAKTAGTAFTLSTNDSVSGITEINTVPNKPGPITITLPSSPANNDIVKFLDLKGTFGTNNLTIVGNGNNIMGSSSNMVKSTNNDSFGLIFINGDWRQI